MDIRAIKELLVITNLNFKMILPLYTMIYLVIFGAIGIGFIISTIIIVYQCIMDRPKKKDCTKLSKKELDWFRKNEDF